MQLPRFDHRFVRALPADPETRNLRQQVIGAWYSLVSPAPVGAPQLAGWSEDLGGVLGIDRADCGDDELAAVLLPRARGDRGCGSGRPWLVGQGG